MERTIFAFREKPYESIGYNTCQINDLGSLGQSPLACWLDIDPLASVLENSKTSKSLISLGKIAQLRA
jgi:hypothetical protein